MKNILFTLLISLSALTSCTITKKVSINFEKETDTTLLQSLEKNNVIYNKGDLATLKNIVVLSQYSQQGKLSIPEAYFFNKEGYRVHDNFKGTRCGQVITNIEKVNDAPVENKEHISDWIKDYNFMADPAIEGLEYDAYVILTWGNFIDKDAHAANETAFKWYKSLKEDKKNLKIKTILLNLDVQDTWGITKEQEDALGMGK